MTEGEVLLHKCQSIEIDLLLMITDTMINNQHMSNICEQSTPGVPRHQEECMVRPPTIKITCIQTTRTIPRAIMMAHLQCIHTEDHGVVVMTEVWKNSSEEPAPVDALLLLKPGVKGLPHHVKGHLYLIGVND